MMLLCVLTYLILLSISLFVAARSWVPEFCGQGYDSRKNCKTNTRHNNAPFFSTLQGIGSIGGMTFLNMQIHGCRARMHNQGPFFTCTNCVQQQKHHPPGPYLMWQRWDCKCSYLDLVVRTRKRCNELCVTHKSETQMVSKALETRFAKRKLNKKKKGKWEFSVQSRLDILHGRLSRCAPVVFCFCIHLLSSPGSLNVWKLLYHLKDNCRNVRWISHHPCCTQNQQTHDLRRDINPRCGKVSIRPTAIIDWSIPDQ